MLASSLSYGVDGLGSRLCGKDREVERESSPKEKEVKAITCPALVIVPAFIAIPLFSWFINCLTDTNAKIELAHMIINLQYTGV
jgi:hypothetical protein